MMDPQPKNLEEQVTDVIVAWRNTFPNIEIPSPEWLQHWLTKYSSESVLDAIQTLGKHPFRARLDAGSVGRAISSSLRANAVKRAVAAAITKTGGTR